MNFVEKNAKLIRDSDWNTIYYEKLPKEMSLASGEFTDFLLAAGIDPLEGWIAIPRGYLCGSRQTAFTIPDRIDVIEPYAFYGSKLKSIIIPKSVRSIGVSAFEASTLSEVQFEGDSIVLGNNCFSTTDIKKLTLPGTIPMWDGATFQSCQKLTSVVISEGVDVLPLATFKGCTQLESLTLPSTIKRIGRQCLMGAPLEEISFGGTVEQWNSIKKADDWNEGALLSLKIKCADGEIQPETL